MRRKIKHLSKLDKREQKKIPTEHLSNMAEFVLKSNFFEFSANIKQQISRTAIRRKYAPTYACVFCAYFWNGIFYKHKIINHFYGSDIQTIFSLFGLVVRKNNKTF